MSRARVSRSVSFNGRASFISIARFRPVTTSTLLVSRNVTPRFAGVPPNMSASTSTPPGFSAVFTFSRTRSIARPISCRARSTSSCQPIETAVKCGRSPTIISAAFNSSAASCPCVTTTTPTFMSVDRNVAVADAHLHALPPREPLLDRLRNHDRSVPAASAADPDRQVRLALGDVLRHQEPKQVERVFEEVVRRVGLLKEGADLAVATGVRTQPGHEMRIGQEADVEQQIRVDRNAVLEPETQHGHHQLRSRRAAALDITERVAQLVDGHR